MDDNTAREFTDDDSSVVDFSWFNVVPLEERIVFAGGGSVVTNPVPPFPDAHSPTTVADSASTHENVAVSGNVLANDVLGSNNSSQLVALLRSQPLHGVITAFDSDGSFTYVPNLNYVGSDSFRYYDVQGGSYSLVNTVTLTISGGITAQNELLSGIENRSLTISQADLLHGDSDVNAGASPLIASLVGTDQDGNIPTANGGLLHDNGDGTFVYTPPAGLVGSNVDSFEFQISDGIDTITMTANIDIMPNSPPVAGDDSLQSYSNNDATISESTLLSNDQDPNGDPLLFAGIASQPLHGMVVDNNGVITYSLNPTERNYVGQDSFTYSISDGYGGTAIGTVTLNIAASPVIAANDTYSVPENLSLVSVSSGSSGVTTTVDPSQAGSSAGAAAPIFRPQNNDFNLGTAPGLVLDSSPQHGTATLSNGGITYTPNPHFYGSDSFTYHDVNNQLGLNSNIATITFNVIPPPPPTANNDSFILQENSPGVSLNVLANDTDPSGLALTPSLVDGPANGAVVLNSDGTFTYTPNAGFFGADSFTYNVSDGVAAASNIATVSINVDPIPVVAHDDSFIVYKNSVDVTLNILANDTNPNGLPLEISYVSSPLHGTANINPDGTIAYTPEPGFQGPDSFFYFMDDGITQSGASVTILVRNPPAPFASNDSFILQENSGASSLDVLANDTNPNQLALTPALVSGPANGTVVLNPDGTFSYTPNHAFHGADSFTYNVTDSAGAVSNAATVNIQVSIANPIANDDSYTLSLATNPILVVDAQHGLLANDSDPSDLPLTIATVDQVTLPIHGTLQVNPDGSFYYSPNNGFSGIDQFSYTVFDGFTLSMRATVTIEVVPAPAPPFASNDSLIGVPENYPGAHINVTSNDTDPNGLALTPSIVDSPLFGTVTAAPNGFIYTPNAGFFGSDRFTYVDTNSAGAVSNLAIVNISVRAQAPLPLDPNGIVTLNAEATMAGATVPTLHFTVADILAQNSYIAGDLFTINGIPIGDTNLSVGILHNDGAGNFSLIPNSGIVNASIPITLSDITNSTFASELLAFNVVPGANAANDSFTIGANQLLTGNVLGNDSAPNGQAIHVISAGFSANGVAVVMNANGDFQYQASMPTSPGSPDSFTYQIQDSVGSISQGVVLIEVTPSSIIVAPENQSVQENVGANSYQVVGNLSFNVTDPNLTNPQYLFSANNPAHGSLLLDPHGQYIYTPNSGFYGADSFSYTVTDQLGAVGQGIVNITVLQAPPVVMSETLVVLENGSLIIHQADLLANDTDPNNLALTAGSLVATNGTITDLGGGNFLYTPAVNAFGLSADTISYVVSDGGTSASGVALIDITPAAPNALAQNFQMIENNGTITFDPLAPNSAAVSGDTIALINLPLVAQNGTIIDNHDGTFTYMPNHNFVGSDVISYQIIDQVNGATASNTITIVVSPAPAPTANADSYQINQNGVLTVPAIGVLMNDIDPSGFALNANLVSGPAHGFLQLNSDGSFVYTPASNFIGIDQFSYAADDGHGGVAQATVSITVKAVGIAAETDHYIAQQNRTLSIAAAQGVLANDIDSGGFAMTASINSQPAHGVLTLSANGSFRYVPVAGYFGPDSFTYLAKDARGNSAIGIVNIDVNAPPVAAKDSYIAQENQNLVVSAAAGVLVNDTDPNGDHLTASIVRGPAHGTIALNPDGSFNYMPAVNFFGTDSFTYQARDGNGGIANATVSLKVVIAAPIVNPDLYSVNQGEVLSIGAPGVGANDSDINGFALKDSLVTKPMNGKLVFHSDGSFTYTPNIGFVGVDSFTYKANDGHGGIAQALVTINVVPAAHAPIFQINGVDNRVYVEDRGPVIVALSVSVKDLNTTSFNNGQLIVNIANADPHDQLVIVQTRALMVDANLNLWYKGINIGTVSGGKDGAALVINFNGNATPAIAAAVVGRVGFYNLHEGLMVGQRAISFTLSDGIAADGSTTVMRHVMVYDDNDPPRISELASLVTIRRASMAIAETVNVGHSFGININDVNNQPNDLISVTLKISKGSISLDPTRPLPSSIIISVNTGSQITFTGNQNDVNALLDSLNYTTIAGAGYTATLCLSTFVIDANALPDKLDSSVVNHNFAIKVI